MKESEVVFTLKRMYGFYGTITHHKATNKYKSFWLRRGYKVVGSWKIFDYRLCRIYIVRALDREGLKKHTELGRYLLEVNFIDSTEWGIYKSGRWMRFRTKCEAEDYAG